MATTEVLCTRSCVEVNDTMVQVTEEDCSQKQYSNDSCEAHERWAEQGPYKTPYDGFMAALLISLGISIVFFNVVCLRAIYRHDLCGKDHKFMFIGNMAITDLTLGATILSFHALDYCVTSGSLVRTVLCIIGNTITEVTLAGTVMSLMAVSIERYLKIVYPLKHGNMVTDTRIRVGIGVIWILAIGHGFLPIIGMNWDAIEPSNCSFLHMVSCPFLLYSFIAQFLVPIATIAVLHGRIVRIALRHRRQIQDQFLEDFGLAKSKSSKKSRSSSSPRVTRYHWKGMMTMIIVVVVVVVCWTPYYALALMKMVDPVIMTQEWTLYAADASYFLYYTNSLLNPVIWSKRIPEVRQDLSAMCSCKKEAV